jgi:hypothetical protein
MAIKVQVTADNGIITEYHRIALLSIDVNNQNTILVLSYLSESGRQVEKDYAAGLYKDVEAGMMKFPYVNGRYINIPYDGTMTIEAAYQYLKTLPEFEGSIDV